MLNGPSIIFFISLGSIIAMFAIKLVESRTGNKSFLTKVSENANPAVHHHVGRCKHILSYCNKRNAIALYKYAVYHLILATHRLYSKTRELLKKHLEKKPSSPINMILGRGVLEKKGSVSFFLKHIAEESKKKEVVH